jgi:hypothetical protein
MEEALSDYRASEVACGIRGIYQVQGTPRIEEFAPMPAEKLSVAIDQ